MSVIKADIYQQITDTIVSAIEKGVGDFIMPWHRGGGEIPININSGNEYQGINILNLWVTEQTRGFNSSTWGTYRQWKEKECQVRKGEKSSPIIFYKQLMYEDEQGEDQSRRLLKSYSVFNSDQVDGYTPPETETIEPLQRLEHVDKAIQSTGATVLEGGDKAYYKPSTDTVHMPDSTRFIGDNACRTESYYAVLWHELGHWSGKTGRCSRDLSGRFGDEKYAMEELVAELSSAYCCAKLGISTEPRADHACYIANWLEVLKQDKKAVFYASARAQEAATYLL